MANAWTIAGLFLLTYCLHSTLLLGMAWICLRMWRDAAPDYRAVIWKVAMFAGVLTSLLQVFGVLPHFGVGFTLADGGNELATNQPALVATIESYETSARVPGIASDSTKSLAPADHEMSSAEKVIATRNTSSQPSRIWASVIFRTAIAGWLIGAVLLMTHLALGELSLRMIRRRCQRLYRGELVESIDAISRRLSLKTSVEVYLSEDHIGPMIGGLYRTQMFLPRDFVRTLDRSQLEALLAHELSHVLQRDAWWNLAMELVCRIFYFQPLNLLARREIRVQSEYLADRRTAAVLAGGLGLARCLADLANWSKVASPRFQPAHALTAGMGAFRSLLGRRVEFLLNGERQLPPPGRRLGVCVAVAFLLTTIVCFCAPRAVATPSPRTESTLGESSMLRSSSLKNVVGTLAVVAGIASPAVAEPPANSRLVALADAGAEVSALPDGAAGFDGQVVGIVAGRRDDGAVLFRVVKVQQVWPNANKSTNPDSLNGKTIVVRANAGPDSVQAQFVGKLQVNDESRLNIRQYEGSLFVVTELTEEQRKMAARETPTARESSADAKDDLTKSPPELYGLSGRVIGRLVSRDPEQGELTLKIVKVDRVWKGNKAKEPNSAEGRTLKIEGVFGKFLDTLLTLKAGDGVQIEVKHVKGDNLVFLGEELMKVVIEDEDSTLRDSSPSTSPTTKPDGASAEIPAGLRGFRGIMIGSLVSKDTEAGTLVFKMDRVKQTWKQNKAEQPQQAVGKSLTVKGISGKFLDTLLLLQPGDQIEVEAFHVSGSQLDFPGEWLKKVE